MRGTLKTAALEHYFPLLAVEHDCILSKNAEVTVAYRVVLPELFTLTGAEYEALHGAWLKALRVLPDYTIVHKVGSINSIFYFLHKAAEPFNCLEQDNLA